MSCYQLVSGHGIIYLLSLSNVNRLPHLNAFCKRILPKAPKHFYSGPRKSQILLIRLRTKCSSLNFDLFVKNIADSPLCQCGSIESAQHFFFHCTFYQAQRNELMNAISPYQQRCLNLFLFGDLSLSQEINKIILEHVYKFITSSKCF